MDWARNEDIPSMYIWMVITVGWPTLTFLFTEYFFKVTKRKRSLIKVKTGFACRNLVPVVVGASAENRSQILRLHFSAFTVHYSDVMKHIVVGEGHQQQQQQLK